MILEGLNKNKHNTGNRGKSNIRTKNNFSLWVHQYYFRRLYTICKSIYDITATIFRPTELNLVKDILQVFLLLRKQKQN